MKFKDFIDKVAVGEKIKIETECSDFSFINIEDIKEYLSNKLLESNVNRFYVGENNNIIVDLTILNEDE